MRRLKNEAENIKRVLSSATSADIVLDALADGEDLDLTITRDTFVKINQKYFSKITPMLEQLLKYTKKESGDISKVIMVGGSSRIPYVRGIIKGFFPKAEFDEKPNADETVAIGAARVYGD